MQEFSSEYAENHFITPTSFATMGGILPILIGRNLAKPNYLVGPWKIDRYSLHFVMEGQVQLMYDDHRIILRKGDIFCKFPHTTYTYQIVHCNEPLKMNWITFNGGQSAPLLEMAGIIKDNPYRRKVIGKEVEMTLQQIMQVSKHLNKKQHIALQGLIYRIFSQLIPDQDYVTASSSPADWIRKSLDFIHVYYTEKISVNDVANHVGVHRTHFSKSFTETVGLPPIKYIHKIRLEKSRSLLDQTKMSISDIAMMVGYPDAYSYIRAFSKQFGCSPGRMRKQMDLLSL